MTDLSTGTEPRTVADVRSALHDPDTRNSFVHDDCPNRDCDDDATHVGWDLGFNTRLHVTRDHDLRYQFSVASHGTVEQRTVTSEQLRRFAELLLLLSYGASMPEDPS